MLKRQQLSITTTMPMCTLKSLSLLVRNASSWDAKLGIIHKTLTIRGLWFYSILCGLATTPCITSIFWRGTNFCTCSLSTKIRSAKMSSVLIRMAYLWLGVQIPRKLNKFCNISQNASVKDMSPKTPPVYTVYTPSWTIHVVL